MKTLITDIPYFRNGEYITFPTDINLILNNLGLGISERLFYIGFITAFGTEIKISQPELSNYLGFSLTTIKKIISNLQEQGLLEVESGIGRSIKNTYKIKYLYHGNFKNAVGL